MLCKLVVITAAIAGVLVAQDPPSRVARLSYLSGAVSFEAGGANDWVDAQINRPLTIGDQIFADDGARAEIHAPGVAFRLGSRTAFEFLNLDDRSVQVRLSEGSLDISVRRLDGNLEVSTPALAFTIRSPGEYRIDTNPDTVQDYATVRSGSAEITTNSGTFPLQNQQTAVVTGGDQAQYQVYAASAPDDFDRWAESREAPEQRIQSAKYVSPEVVGYEDLDQYGSWESAPDYGSVWIPRSVPVGWAPYHAGHWVWIDPWGWTWVDDQPWGFAPFHYGRWAFYRERWCWVPGPVAVAPVYAPALVAWFGFGGGVGVAFSSGFAGDVGWFPLGPRDVFVPAYRTSSAYFTRINTANTRVINNVQITNVYNNYTRTGAVPIAGYSNRAIPGAAVAIPQNALTGARPVQQAAVRVQPNQLNALNSIAAAPRVAPQQMSVSGPVQRGNVPRPSQASMNRPVVARMAPPPGPAPLAQRLPLLAKDPGKPIPIQQQNQLARSTAAAAAQPPVKVLAQTRSVSPTVMRTAPPAPSPRGVAAQQPASPAPNAATPRPGPPRPAAPVQAERSVEPPGAQPRAQQPNRPFEPPTAQPHPAPQAPTPQANVPRPVPQPQAQPNRPVQPPTAQPRPATQGNIPRPAPQPQAQPNRPFEPPTAQPRPGPQAPAPQANAPRPAPQPQAQPNRPVQPPPAQPRPAPQAPTPQAPTPQANAPRPVPQPQAQPNRPVQPPAPQPRPAPQAPAPQTPAPQANVPRPAPQPQAQPARPVQPPPAQPRPAPQANAPRPAPQPQAQPARPVQPPPPQPHPAPQPQAQPNRPVAPPAAPPQPAPRAAQPPPQPRGQPNNSRPPDQKKDEKR